MVGRQVILPFLGLRSIHGSDMNRTPTNRTLRGETTSSSIQGHQTAGPIRNKGKKRDDAAVGMETASGGGSREAAQENFDAGKTLLRWYDRCGRQLPWRIRPEDRQRGMRPDPYRVWLSEIMLQQTRVAAATPYYHAFLERWPTVESLAASPVEAIMERWAGLGYYARARNLHACARTVVSEHGGQFPSTVAELRNLPGIGPYTASAIGAIAFDIPTVPVDGNVERVMARFHGVQDALPGAKPRLRQFARLLEPSPRPGDLAQALMDLGATVCTPRNPDCGRCPWQNECAAHRNGWQADLPRRDPKPARPVRRGVAYVIRREDGAVWLCRRPAKGLLGGMLGLPGTAWTAEEPSETEAHHAAPVSASWQVIEGEVQHVFTHFELRLRVHVTTINGSRKLNGGNWVEPFRLADTALPTVMRKALEHGLRQTIRDLQTNPVGRDSPSKG